MVKFMFFGVAATLLGFSCRADAWGGKKKDVSGVTWLVRRSYFFLFFLLPASRMTRT